ncbi:hypothetical protein ACG7TL_000933 [Trametes sanguinea]
MAPLSFAKLFSQRDSRRSTESRARSSIDSSESIESYVISLPSIYPVSSSVSNTPTTGSAFTAEMLEDDNLSWGRPSRVRSSRRQ